MVDDESNVVHPLLVRTIKEDEHKISDDNCGKDIKRVVEEIINANGENQGYNENISQVVCHIVDSIVH